MKRANDLISVAQEECYLILPQELIVEILCYITVEQKRRWSTVCQVWATVKGLIDQSIYSLTRPVHTACAARVPCFLNMRIWRPYPDLRDLRESLSMGTILNRELRHLVSLTTLDLRCIYKRNLLYEGSCNYLTVLGNLKSLRLPRGAYMGEALRSFTRLERLRVEKSSCVTDHILCGLTHLTRLSLLETQISNEVLFTLTNLRRLNLYYNARITSVGVAAQTNLRQLKLNLEYGDKGEEVNTGLRFLTGLTSLNALDNTPFVGDNISRLTNLRSLSIRHLPVTTIESFSLLSRLDVSFCDKDVMQCLARLPSLKALSLNLFLCPALSAEHIHCLTQLTELDMKNNFGCSLSLSAFTALTTLRLSHDSGMCQQDYKALPVSLRTLDLTQTLSFREEEYPTLVRLTNLTCLCMSMDNLSFLTSGVLSRLVSLQVLILPPGQFGYRCSELYHLIPPHIDWRYA